MRIARYRNTRYWAVIDTEDTLVCLCVYRKGGIHLRRDNLVSVIYSEELDSGKSSDFLQRTDRHGILGQKHCDLQVSL